MMRALLVAAPLIAVLALSGCGAEKNPTMPDVTGKKLDLVYAELKDAGLDEKDEIAVEGGGIFGIVMEGNWTVCVQSPAPGEAVTGEPKLTVERSCEDKTPDEPAEPPTDEQSDQASPSDPPLPEILTTKNTPELRALLAQPENCDPSVARFTQKYAGNTIRFNGSVSAFANHGDYDTRFDILVGVGDKGPNTATGPTFQFVDVNLVSDMNLTGKVPDSWGLGEKATFTAEVLDYDKSTCLVHLSPVETRVR